ALLVRRMAHRPDLESLPPTFESDELLCNKGLGKPWPALQDDRQPSGGRLASGHVFAGTLISDLVSAMIFSSPSMKPAGAFPEGGFWKGSSRMALAMTSGPSPSRCRSSMRISPSSSATEALMCCS